MRSACSYLRIQVTVQTAANGEEKKTQRIVVTQLPSKYLLILMN